MILKNPNIVFDCLIIFNPQIVEVNYEQKDTDTLDLSVKQTIPNFHINTYSFKKATEYR